MNLSSLSALLRVLSCVAALVTLASCTDKTNTDTFQGEPLIQASAPDAVVHTIDDPRYPAVLLTHEKGAVGIGIFQPVTRSPVLTLRDDDNDGVFDLLTYSALSKSGESQVDVEDYGMDGQPDFILNHEKSTASVFVDGEWHEVIGVGTHSATVLLNGEQIPLDAVMSRIRKRD